jgi:5-methylcytosine-specific restriction enzyme subunit McrC
MRQLTLFEYRPSEPYLLSQAEVAALVGLKAVSIAPTDEPGHYILTAGSYVGTVQLPDLSIALRPKIEVQRLLFLVSYALDPSRWSDEVFDLPEDADVVEAIVPAFVSQVRRATTRGLLQGYTVKEEALPLLRGRLRFDDQLRRHYGQTPPAESRFDDFTEDIEMNRMLRAATRALGRPTLRQAQSRRDLRLLDRALDRAAAVEYDRRLVPVVSYSRLNEHYRPAVELARLILRDASFDLGHGDVTGTAFLFDMNDVFENFVLVALREALGLNERDFPQGTKGRPFYLNTDDHDQRVRIRPDLSWWEGDRCVFVGDAKYKRLSIKGYEHADLYQLLAYCVASGLPGGLLIYAVGERPERTYTVSHAGKRLEVVTLALDGSPQEVLGRVRELAERVRWWAREGQANFELLGI